MTSKTNKIYSCAPARICLFGDHQDYLGMPVITGAIDRQILLTGEENGANYLEIITPDINKSRRIFLKEDFSEYDGDDHYKSSLYVLQRRGLKIDKGYTVTITGDIPINAGLSSSSAIVVAWVQFLLYAFGHEKSYEGELISNLAYQAEVEIHGAPGGKMDQYAIGVGNVLFINTGSLFGIKTLNSKLPVLIIGESGIPKNTIGLLKKTRQGAIKALKQVKSKHPNFDVETTKEDDIGKYLGAVDLEYQNYFKAAIINHNVTLAAYQVLNNDDPDPETLGKLMNKHHYALKDLLGVTVPRIDAMTDAAMSAGAYGTKIVGSGGGGCILALASEEKKDGVISAIKKAGAKDAFEVAIAGGAHFYRNSAV